MNILSIGVSALVSNRQALDTTGHNIANVNTEGYSRQRLTFSTREPNFSSQGYTGNGVKTSAVQRQYSDFIANQLRASQSATSELQAYYSGARVLDDLVADADVGIQPTIQNFFNAMQGLADDPASVTSRQLVLAESESMVDRFHYFDQYFESNRTRLNEEIEFDISELNRLAQGIADINADIRVSYGCAPNDLLDKRDQLINELSALVDIQVSEQSDGAFNVFIGKGQPLVMADDAANLTAQPSDLDPTRLEIAFNFSFGTQVVTDQISGGSIGGKLRFRDEILDPVQNRVGLVALAMANDLNAQHRMGVDLDGLQGGNLFTTGSVQVLERASNGGSITATYDDINQLTGDDYELFYDGSDFILRNLSDDSTQTLAAGVNIVDGLSIDINAVGATAGDTFLIQPTRNGAANLEMLITDARRLAAASPLQIQPNTDANGNALNTGDTVITQPANSSMTGLPLGAGGIQLVYDDQAGATSGFEVYYPGSVPGVDPFDDFITYDNLNPATISGTNVPSTTFAAYGGMSFDISGIPADGDSFTIGNNTNGSSDNRNARGLVALQSMEDLLGGSANYDEAYSQVVSDVGAKTHHAELSMAAQESLLGRSKDALGEISGVNVDEEAANLIKFQQAYQASAQLISVANTLLDSLLNAVGR